MSKSKPAAPASTPRVTAETLAAKQRDISVSEFFAKNRHLLGFDNPRKALLTTVKEAVDNSLDACEEAGILPDITVVIEDLQPDRPASAKVSRYRITVVDNGPGIVRKQVENVFGRLLFGSKFHRLKMSRGQQGIGISAAGMYGLITTGKPMLIQTRPSAMKPAHHIELAMNTKTNRAEVTVDEETDDFPLARLRDLPQARELTPDFLSHSAFPTGTSVTIELEGKYQRGRGSVDEFLELTAIANPHAKITLVRPTRVTDDEDDAPLLKKKKSEPSTSVEGSSPTAPSTASQDSTTPDHTIITNDLGPCVVFPRAVNQLPPETKEIQPHPRGVELGTLLQMVKDFEAAEKSATLYTFLQEKFCRISPQTASEFCQKIGLTSRTKVSDVEPAQIEKLFKEFQDSKLAPPPTDCLAPIGVQQLLKGMFKGVRAEFYAASSREASVYRGRPFLIETAIAFGGELPADDSARVIRFANRVPLLFQQSACSSFKAVTETNWRNYDLQQPRGAAPVGPLVIMIHMASVWVPFTSESKEAIADYDEIRKEMKLALMECGRKLGSYLRKRLKMRREAERRDVFERYIGEITKAVSAINNADAKKLYEALTIQAKKATAIADLQLNDEGKALKDEDPADQEGVLILDSASTSASTSGGADKELAAITGQTKAQRAMLAVVGQSDDDEDSKKGQGKLLDVATIKRSESKPARKSTKPSAKPAKPPAPSAGKPASPSESAKPAKPKMRLVNGKLVPAEDGPKLF
ncbi:MAG: DNA topoisomerase VI subunit B [Phycisphaerales bacterium]|nr:DNA topoisomerase VI subunit B [Phycisphaerales bacterium]